MNLQAPVRIRSAPNLLLSNSWKRLKRSIRHGGLQHQRLLQRLEARQGKEAVVASKSRCRSEVQLWGLAQLMVQIWCVTVPLGLTGVEACARLTGHEVAELSNLQKALAADATQAVELLYLALLLRHTDLQWAAVTTSDARKSILYGLLGGAAAFLAVQLCAVLSNGAYADADLQAILSGSNSDIGALLLASVLLTPLLEELIYRGILLTGLSHLVPATQAIGLSSIAFAVSHFSGGQNFVPLTVLGSVLGCTYLASSKSLWASFVAHAGYNIAALVVMYSKLHKV